jgi:hypothetical protein
MLKKDTEKAQKIQRRWELKGEKTHSMSPELGDSGITEHR